MRHETGLSKKATSTHAMEVSLCYEEGLWGNVDDGEVMVGILPCSHNFIKGTKFLEEIAGYK